MTNDKTRTHVVHLNQPTDIVPVQDVCIGDVFEVISGGPDGELMVATWFDNDYQSYQFVNLRNPESTFSDALGFNRDEINSQHFTRLGWMVRILRAGTVVTLTIGERA